ncbi:hypothetical protein HW115_13195 [Verrucomicrobiaceae bacterium N1E253]|uniref:Uncharacterized protein n=1 Tax=Oceaniferula marina TaxID=2748318 RepID=A0A851GL58_9BACT|nr:hypothetical protein [Oceaniferula marina]NWK56571.1 hypothetical protein [Oceaniferula marina]
MKNRVCVLGALVCLISLAWVWAQEEAPQDPPQKVEYKLSMIAVGERSDAYWEGDDEEMQVHARRPEAALPSALSLMAGSSSQDVKLRLNVPSPRYVFTSSAFRLMKGKTETYTSVRMPEKGGAYSLFLTQNEEKKSWMAPSLFIVPDGLDVFPSGSLRVVNVSTLPLEIHLGDELVKTLEPQSWHVLQGVLDEEKVKTLALWYTHEERRRPAFRRQLAGMAGKRMNISCSVSRREGRPVASQFFENIR